MSRILRFGRVAVLLAWIAVPTTAHADWRVRNNLGERFTIYVWPSNDPTAIQSRTLRDNEQARIPLGQDRHEIELLSRGGDLYVLEPARLTNRTGETDLKTILTPRDRRVRGRVVYDYMNQEGFNSGDTDRLDNLEWSAWRTTYATPNGGSVTTDLKFCGNVGTYNGGRGKLSEITYEDQGNVTLISGKWVFNNGADGRFTFYVDNDDPDEFTSTQDGRNSNWSGSRRTVAPD